MAAAALTCLTFQNNAKRDYQVGIAKAASKAASCAAGAIK
ncbi:hypothetical protein CGMCC3_g11208 [Colletotrichum fructicola]|nr:uncharacterized protein CGMCC3_g11208 [Colletotrichum fructicola]KAE9572780.1 hypothetical protein CGMCC3_g11208 [Colletotrichum fructicola]